MYGDRVPRHLFALVTRPYRLRNRTKVVPIDRELTADERRLLRRIAYIWPYDDEVRVSLCALLDIVPHLHIMRTNPTYALWDWIESTVDPQVCTRARC